MMEIIKIVIFSKDSNYACDLAEALSQCANGMDISVITREEQKTIESLKDTDIVLSDKDEAEYKANYLLLEGRSEIKCSTQYRKNNRVLSKFEPVTHILQRIIEIYEEQGGKSFDIKSEANTLLYGFRSETGGSGTTAAALTVARIMACEEEKNVLYISMGGSESRSWYIEETMGAMRPTIELEYRIRNKYPFNIYSYVSRERYGVYVLSGLENANNKEKILKAICEKNTFDVIVADMPEFAGELSFFESFLVGNEKDFRERCLKSRSENREKFARRTLNTLESRGEVERGRIRRILNRSGYNHVDGEEIHIIDDPESFIFTGERIEIALDGAFANGLRRILTL